MDLHLGLNVGDINSDGLDDLTVSEHNLIGEPLLFNIYQQTQEGSFPTRPSQSLETPFEEWSWVCLLDVNKDGQCDLIRNTWLREPWFLPGIESGKVLVRIFLAGPDGSIANEPQYVFRKNDWTPFMPIVDIDGDGFVDLVLGYGQFDSREGIRKAITAKKLAHNLRFHFYQDNGFRQSPDSQKDIAVVLDRRGPYVTARGGRVKERMNLAGDFNGDGMRDLLVNDTQGQASIYFFKSRNDGFSKRPDMSFNIEPGRFIISDLNKDKISDLIVAGSNKKSFRVFLSGGK